MFELTTPTTAKLSTLTPRTEKHGDDDVSAISMGLTIIGPNTLLDALSPNLRDALYTAKPGEEEQLPGMPVHTPLRRTKDIESLALAFKFEGWTLHIDYGIEGDTDPMVLGGCKIDKFKLVTMEGGSIELSFRVGTNDLDTREAGILFGEMGHDLTITIAAPERLPETEKPPATPPSEDERQATILGAMQDGAGPDEQDEDGSEGEGSDPDAAPAAEPPRGPAWPFPEETLRKQRAAAVAESGNYGVKLEPPAKKKAPAKKRVPYKFRDPMTGDTWSGRGLKPQWLRTRLDQGKKLADFDVSQQGAAA